MLLALTNLITDFPSSFAALGNLLIKDRQVLGKTTEFAHMPLDCQ